MSQHLDRLARRVIFGPGGAESIVTDLDKLRFMRRFLALAGVPLSLALVLALAWGAPTLLWIVMGVGWASWLSSALKLPFDLRREHQRRG